MVVGPEIFAFDAAALEMDNRIGKRQLEGQRHLPGNRQQKRRSELYFPGVQMRNMYKRIVRLDRFVIEFADT